MSEIHPALKTPQTWRNKKTNGLYFAKGVIVNTTNAVDGQLMVLYEAVHSGFQFVREESEFLEKFVPIHSEKI
jgi:hypothetical protein